ncbi:hypothetical protein [Pseudomonas sp. NFACC42-2]|uniref:hypothetical protein n=1 Tax=Pseudomonas sp. NFACC42-2 TaxID=1566193 RepID=UPI0008EA665C|nr:hypothetical protein [Pseudomonas sp. NFACC42-2]SFS27615.1 hypothetical protein SAMN03159318_03920 [Pseudomonas sp. NFACC42-2]
MTWYKTGTVAVTQGSNAVIGTGTSFIANSRVGDGFRGPDGGWYEITNIASDTAMAISPPYGDSSAYSIAPLQGYLKDSADALRTATKTIAGGVADMQEQVATATEAAESAGQSKTVATEQAGIATAAANASAGNKEAAQLAAQQSESSAVESGAAADRAETAKNSIIQSEQAAAASAAAAAESAEQAEEVTLGKAASGANSDITSLSGLTTPLSIEQGGNGGGAGVQKSSANVALNNGRYTTPGTWTGSVYPGADGRNQGYLVHDNWTSDYARQTWTSLDSSITTQQRFKTNGAWGAWKATTAAPAWGVIGGTLSAQTDLQATLDLKQNASSAALIPVSANFMPFNRDSVAAVLPAGGTYAWWIHQANNQTGALIGASSAGVSAGGTTIKAATAGQYIFGFYWRIS